VGPAAVCHHEVSGKRVLTQWFSDRKRNRERANQTNRNFWRRSVKERHLISVDERRAAGALDVPPAWRKSLGGKRVERDLFSGLSDSGADEDTAPEQGESAEGEPDGG
jgi:hypothetical protein